MGMRGRRAGVAAGLAVTVLLTATGCGDTRDGRLYPTGVDVARAQRAWTDPWLAPQFATTTASPADLVPEGVERLVGFRDVQSPASPVDAVLSEVRAAVGQGWALTGVTCGEDEVVASLSKGTDDLETAMTAWVSGSRETHAVEGFDVVPTDVTVRARVPHHLDGSWPAPEPVAVEDTCLAGVSGAPDAQEDPEVRVLQATGSPTGSVTGEARSAPAFEGSGLPADLVSAVDAAGDDPVLVGLGIEFGWAKDDGVASAWKGRTGARALPTAVEDGGGVTPADVDEVVSSAVDEGWALTYSSCLGSDEAFAAELRRIVADPYSAVLRLDWAPAAVGSQAGVLSARVVVTSPQWGGPDETLASAGPCWAVDARDAVFATTGTPWFGPTVVWPTADDE
jgi:hypothetical protein